MGWTRYKKMGSCGPANWQELESPEAKSIRGHGWWYFRRLVFDDRGRKCERCGRDQIELHVHHIKPVRTHRHLRFEKSNTKVLCRLCHPIEENSRRSSQINLSEMLTADKTGKQSTG